MSLIELPWQAPDSRSTDEPLPLGPLLFVAVCDAPPSDSDNESVAADVEDPFADVTHGEALDTSGPSKVDEVQHMSVSSGVAHHLAETTADVAEVVASQTATACGKHTKT